MDPEQIQPGVDLSQVPPQPMPPTDPSAVVPGAGAQAPMGQLITDEQKQELLSIIQDIRQKIGSLSTLKFASGNKTEKIRSDLLRQVFEKLQLAGVDLTDQQSVSDFLAKLQQDNPELAQQFEKSMNALLGDPSASPFGPPPDANATIDLGIPPQNMNNQNQNENPNQLPAQDPTQMVPQA